MLKFENYIRTLLSCSVDGVVNILMGNTSFVEKNKLTISQKQKLFLSFIDIANEQYNETEDVKIITNAKMIFLILYKDGMFNKRRDDLDDKTCVLLNNILEQIDEIDIENAGYNDDESVPVYAYIHNIQKRLTYPGMFSHHAALNPTKNLRRNGDSCKL